MLIEVALPSLVGRARVPARQCAGPASAGRGRPARRVCSTRPTQPARSVARSSPATSCCLGSACRVPRPVLAGVAAVAIVPLFLVQRPPRRSAPVDRSSTGAGLIGCRRPARLACASRRLHRSSARSFTIDSERVAHRARRRHRAPGRRRAPGTRTRAADQRPRDVVHGDARSALHASARAHPAAVDEPAGARARHRLWRGQHDARGHAACVGDASRRCGSVAHHSRARRLLRARRTGTCCAAARCPSSSTTAGSTCRWRHRRPTT